MAWTTIDGVARDVWDYVSRFESYDYAARVYRQSHESSADCKEKVRQINAAFTQGRMYFENASSAAIGVKPLLLYYGAMSLAVGLVLFKDHETVEGSFKRHGLKRLGWNLTLDSGVVDVLGLEIKAQKEGTFRALAANTWHGCVAQTYQGKVRRQDLYPEIRDLGPAAFARDDSTLTLGDLISRSKYTGGSYAAITGEPGRVHRATVRLDGGRVIFWFEPTMQEGIKPEQTFPRNDPSMPLYHYSGQGSMTVVEDFPNGDRLSEFLKLYLMAYVLGMLARYYPSKWMALIRNEEGSGSQPLLARATQTIETEFIREFGQQVAVIVNDPYFFGGHFGYNASLIAGDWRVGCEGNHR